MNNKYLPAFPVECTYTEDGEIKGLQTGNTTGWQLGLTKREIIAMHALQGLLANPDFTYDSVDNFAQDAVLHADALLKELEKQPVP